MNMKFGIDLNVVPSYWNDKHRITIMKKYDNDLYNLVYKQRKNYNAYDIFLQIIQLNFKIIFLWNILL